MQQARYGERRRTMRAIDAKNSGKFGGLLLGGRAAWSPGDLATLVVGGLATLVVGGVVILVV